MSQDSSPPLPPIVSLEKVREKKLEEKKRKNERIFFHSSVSVTCVDSVQQEQEVQVLDISTEGCAFQVPYSHLGRWPQLRQEPLLMRFYFTPKTYLEITLTIRNQRDSIDREARHTRYGCSVDTSTQAYPAYVAFVQFVKLYALHSHREVGNRSLFF